jgi:hypothetical protein
MRHRRFHHGESRDAFTDLLFNALLGFAFMFITAFAMINETSATGKVESKAEILVTVRWADDHPDDIDTLIEDPQGNLLWYRNRDTGLMHLDRDDRGSLADRMSVDGVQITAPINQETATLRALSPGEYVVNVFHFKANTAAPVTVSVKVEKLNPSVTLLHYDTVVLTGLGDEKTALRFTIDRDGNVIDTNTLSKALLSTATRPFR